MLSSPEFWVAVAFVLFFVAVGRKLWVFVIAKLDERSDAIRDELETAVRLREEAQNLLAQYQRKQREASQEAEEIIESARHDAALMKEEAYARIAEQLKRRAVVAEEKIAQAEARAIAEVRAATADIAIAAAARILGERLTDKQQSGLVDGAIKDLDSRLN